MIKKVTHFRRGRYRPSNILTMSGFGQAEEVVEETVTETVGAAPASGLKTAAAVGALAFLGLGLFYGLTKASASGTRRYRWAV